jgi:hypothetical protein
VSLCFIYCCITTYCQIEQSYPSLSESTYSQIGLFKCQNFHLGFFWWQVWFSTVDLVLILSTELCPFWISFIGYDDCLHSCHVLYWLNLYPFQESNDGQSMMEFRRSLPAFKEKQTLLEAISQNQVLIGCSYCSRYACVIVSNTCGQLLS